MPFFTQTPCGVYGGKFFDFSDLSGAPGPARTGNPRFRRPILYPVELRARCGPPSTKGRRVGSAPASIRSMPRGAVVDGLLSGLVHFLRRHQHDDFSAGGAALVDGERGGARDRGAIRRALWGIGCGDSCGTARALPSMDRIDIGNARAAAGAGGQAQPRAYAQPGGGVRPNKRGVKFGNSKAVGQAERVWMRAAVFAARVGGWSNPGFAQKNSQCDISTGSDCWRMRSMLTPPNRPS